MKRVLIAAVLSIALAQSLISQAGGSSSSLAGNSGGAASERVDALFAPWSKGGTPGAAVIIIQNGKVLFKKGYGHADLEMKRPITPDTSFLLGSVTKQFTAMAIMMLVERGKLRYDDPLSKFFPEFPPYAEKVTIRHLLNHTAGFPEYDDLWVNSGRADRDWPRSSKTKPSSFEPTSKDALKLLAQQKELEFAPGQRWKYSNSGYVILAQIVEKVSGKPFSRFLRENIFLPLGMNSTLLYDESRPRVPNVATSYELSGGIYKEIDYTPFNAIYGEDNIYSTVEDMYKWDQALYTEKLVKSSTLKEAFTPGKLSDGTEVHYGFGWQVGKFLGLGYVWHTGSWLGFHNCIMRFPDHRFTVVVLSNVSQLEPYMIASKISKIYLTDKLTFQVARQLDPGLMPDYVGKYEFAPGVTAEVTLENGVLWIKPPGQDKTKLLAESEDQFFPEEMEEICLVFKRDENRHVTSFTVKGGNSARRLP
jgi:CubicO group peptidase (beta-lactamase class C family)